MEFPLHLILYALLRKIDIYGVSLHVVPFLFLNEEDVITGVLSPNSNDLIQFEGNMLLNPHNPFL